MLCCTLDTDNATLSCKKSWRCSDPRKMLGFSLFTWTALSCISVRGMPAGLSQEPEFLDVHNPSYQINADPSTPNGRYLTHFWLWRVMNYEEENKISSQKTTSDPWAVTCFRHVISLTINMPHIVLFLKKYCKILSQWRPLEMCCTIPPGNDVFLTQKWTISTIILDMVPLIQIYPAYFYFSAINIWRVCLYELLLYQAVYLHWHNLPVLCSLDSIQLSSELLHRALNFSLWQFLLYFSEPLCQLSTIC